MCTYSAVMDGWNKIVPSPVYPWAPPQTVPGPINTPPPLVQPPSQIIVQPGFTNEELRDLVETYKQAKDAAVKADQITHQEDCEDDGTKRELESRVAELERRLELVESGTLEECSPSPAESSTSTDVTDPSAYLPPESPTAS